MSQTLLDRPEVAPPPAPSGDHEPPATRPQRFWALAGAFGAFLGLVLLVLLVLLLAAKGDGDARPVGSAAGASTGAKTTAMPVDVELGDMYIKPAEITIAPDTDVVMNVTNKGAMPHNIVLDGGKTLPLIAPGASEKVSLGMVHESTVAYCSVPGHRQAGMEMKINVAGATGAAPAAATSTAAAKDTGAKIDPNATPSADFKPFDPALQPAAGGTTHDITFSMTEKVMEVAPGVTQQLWTFNNQVPGPILRVKLGDVVNLTLKNDGTMGHSIDFHASEVAPNVEMRTIQPGESLVYQFKAEHSGIFMYHCGTAPALHHIGNGMFGALIVDPPDLPKVDKEFVMVQNEFYLGPQGQPGDLTKMTEERFDAVVFNGYWNQYKFSPIHVQPGEKVRVWVLDAGPSENSSFHIVGTIFDTVYKEGAYLLRGGPGAGGAQALDLQPAQGGFVEFTLDKPGTYPMVTHKFANVGKGALGLFMAGDGGGDMAH